MNHESFSRALRDRGGGLVRETKLLTVFYIQCFILSKYNNVHCINPLFIMVRLSFDSYNSLFQPAIDNSGTQTSCFLVSLLHYCLKVGRASVECLAYFITAPAHLRATLVAVYPALFFSQNIFQYLTTICFSK